jgi:hypothetical protein
MPRPIYAVVKLRWIDRRGASQMRQGNALILSKRLETLRCQATLELLDGTKIGGCEPSDGRHGKRLKWAWWYDKDALIVGYESTRTEYVNATIAAAEKAGRHEAA